MSAIELPNSAKPENKTIKMGLPEYKIINDMLIMDIPDPTAIGTHRGMVVLTKEAFLMCYNEWVKKPEEEEDKGGTE